LNTFGQTGQPKKDEDDNTSPVAVAKMLKDFKITQVTGGSHHSIACTEDGKVVVWGRIDNAESGMEIDDIPKEDMFFDENGRARYLLKPLVIPDIEGVFVATGGDTCIAVDKEGKAHSWGFSDNYQTGQGIDTTVKEATHIDNTAVRGKKLVFAGVGGQFGVLGGIAEDV
jgi:regulator of chromosome condensation